MRARSWTSERPCLHRKESSSTWRASRRSPTHERRWRHVDWIKSGSWMDFFCLSETESISSTRTGASGGASDEPRNKRPFKAPIEWIRGEGGVRCFKSQVKKDVLRMAKDVVQDAAEKSKSNDWCPKCKTSGNCLAQATRGGACLTF